MRLLRLIGHQMKEHRTRRHYAKWIDEYNRVNQTDIRETVRIDQSTVANRGVHLEGDSDFRQTTIGKYTYSGESQLSNCLIGSLCSIASGVRLIVNTHPITRVSTWPGFVRILPKKPSWLSCFCENESFSDRKTLDDGKYVHIGNDVWIGQDVQIMGGIEIGDGAVIGAGALVTKDAPPYGIVDGVPARLIRFRFSEDDIRFLLSIHWWDWGDEKIRKYSEYFGSPATLKRALKTDAIVFEN